MRAPTCTTTGNSALSETPTFNGNDFQPAAQGIPCQPCPGSAQEESEIPKERQIGLGPTKDFPLTPLKSSKRPQYMHPKADQIDSHAGGNFIGGNLYPNLWIYLKERFKMTSAIDVGCGLGESTKALYNAGFTTVYAVDGMRENVVESKVAVQYHDFKTGPVLLGKVVDFAWCSEVLEHFDYEMLPNVMMSLLQARVVAANAAAPGQTGHHHVVLRTWEEFWLQFFKTYGFEEIEDITSNILQDPHYVKEQNRGHMWWSLSGHSPGRVLRNKHLENCQSNVDCFNDYLNALKSFKNVPPPPSAAIDVAQAAWERGNR